MKVYLAGEFKEHDIQAAMKRRLFSYWYHCRGGDRPSTDMVEAKEKYQQDMFLDSGAYTASTQKIVIKVDDYAKFWHNAHHLFTVCSSLDDILKNEKVSYENLKALESHGCKVQPVFHTMEDPKWLVRYLDEGYDYIFIGGMVNRSTPWLKGWLDGLFHRYLTNQDGTARVKLHGFGLTDQLLMFRYPWFSVDSASWVFAGVYGGVTFCTPQGLRKVVFSKHSSQRKKIDAWYYGTLPVIQQRQVDKWLERYGVTAQQCADSHRYRNLVNAQTYGEMEQYGTATFKLKERGFFDA